MTNQLLNLDTLQQAKQKVVAMSVEFGPKVLTALLILVIGFFVSRWAAGVFQKWIEKMDLEPPVRILMLRLVRLLVLGMFVVLALQNLNIQLMPLIAGLGIAGAGIALALQGPLSNLAAGMVIIFTKPFRVGEYVDTAGEEGRVEAIELFNTILSHPDLSRIIIPNRKIVGEIMHNYGKIRQLGVVVGVAYSTDLNVALAAVNDVLKQNARVLKDPAPVVRVSMLADSSINIAVNPWAPVTEYGVTSGEINKAIVEEFRARKISIPFPQREVRFLNPPA